MFNNVRWSRMFALGLLTAAILYVCGCSGTKPNTETAPSNTEAAPFNPNAAARTTRTVTLEGTVRLPVMLLQAGFPDSALKEQPGALVVIAGGPDEPPQGPTGFDVTAEGRYIVSDPMRRRIAVYDAAGDYKGEWPVGFPVDSIKETGPGIFRLHASDSSADRFFDVQGKERSAPEISAATPNLTARLAGPNLAVLEGRKSGGPLNISFESGGLRLISVEPLGFAPDGSVYVAIEATPGGETITVSKQVREYAPDGTIVAAVSDIPLPYDFPPTDELKIKRGMLYQLVPLKKEIQIKRWNFNGGK